MHSTIKKLGAILLALTLLFALSATAFAAEDPGEDKSKIDDSTVSSAGVVDDTTGNATKLLTTPAVDNTIEFTKEIVIFNGSSSNTAVYLPNISYTYTLTASGVTEAARITDEYGTAGTVYNGVLSTTKGAVVSTTTDTVVFSNTTGVNNDGNVSVTTSTDGAVASGTASFTFNPANFLHAGIYRYKIAETLTSGTRAAAGIYNTGYHADRYLDVYVQNDIDNTDPSNPVPTFTIYGYVLFDASSVNQNFDAANADLSNEEDGSNAYALKTNGYTSNKTDLSAVTSYDPEELNVDMYYTYNLKVTKTVEGALADKTNEFPFAVRLTNATITSSAMFSYVENSTTATTVQNGVTMTNAGVGTIGTFNGDVAASNSAITLKDGDYLYIYGVPSYGQKGNGISVADVEATALVSEYNNTYDTYRVLINYTFTGHVDEDDSTWDDETTDTIANGATASTTTTAKVDYEDPALINFTNSLDSISPTGVVLRVAPYALMLGAGFIFLAISKRRKEEAEA